MRPFGRRTGGRLARLSGFAVLALALVVSGAGTASATVGENGKPDSTGNNGTLKVHEFGTPIGTENNDPKVCVFNIEGFNFDPQQDLVLKFEVQGGDRPTGQVPTPNEFNVTADENGYFPSIYFNDGGPDIVAGHYKVVAYGKDTGTGLFTDQKAKSKVFKVWCGAPAGDTGTVTVTKALAEGSAPAGDRKFAITVTCESADYTETFHLKATESATTDLLPVDTVCVVTEKTTDGWQTPTIEPNPVKVKEDPTVAVTVTNFKPKDEGEGKTGTVTVTKELADGSQADQGQTFPVTVTCEKHEKVIYTDTFDLKVGESATTTALPVGTKCTVSEEPPEGWDAPTFEPSAKVTVKKGDTVVTVVNSRTSQPPEGKTGTVKVTKELAAGSAPADGQKFPMTVTCEKAGYSDTFEFDLAVGDSQELTKLPAGAVCTVREAVPTGWHTPTFDPSSAVTVVKHETVEVTVVNSRSVTPPPTPTPWASLTLDKTSPQAAAVLGETVTYNLTVTAGGNMAQTNVMVSDPIPAGTTYVVGSAACVGGRTPCTMTEPTASDPTVYWALGTMTQGETVTVTFQVTVSSTLTPNTEITNVGYVKSDQASAKDELVLRTAKVEGEVIVGPTTPTTVTPAVVEGETLPATGAGVPVGYLLGTGVGLIALGALLTALTRRSRSA